MLLIKHWCTQQHCMHTLQWSCRQVDWSFLYKLNATSIRKISKPHIFLPKWYHKHNKDYWISNNKAQLQNLFLKYERGGRCQWTQLERLPSRSLGSLFQSDETLIEAGERNCHFDINKTRLYVNIAQDCELFKAIKGYAWLGKAIQGSSYL